MANIYIHGTQDGWTVRKDGKETAYGSLEDARAKHPEVAESHAALRKGSRLMEDGSLQSVTSYQITPQVSALTGQFEFKGCTYQVVRFSERLPNGDSRIKAAQVFPLHPVANHTDCYISSPDALDSIGFSIRTFLG